MFPCFRHVAVLAFIGVRALFICSCSLHESLIVSFCDRNTVQHSFVASTVLCNALSCMLLFALASVLHNQPPSVDFSCEVCASMALFSLALAHVLRSNVSEPKTEESTEPSAHSNAVTALLNGAKALSAQK
jgi:hypothetical protein